MKRCNWNNVGLLLGGLFLLLTITALLPLSEVYAHEKTPHIGTPITATAQPTPTEDATVTALNKEKLLHENDWWWNYGATILTSIISTFTLAAAGIFTVIRYFNDRRDTRKKEEAEAKRQAQDRQAERERRDEEQQRWIKDREDERIKRAEERFQVAVTGLADKNEGARIGAAILLQTFLHEGNQPFYRQIFDLVVVNLRLQRTTPVLKDPIPEDHSEDDSFFDEEQEDEADYYQEPDPPAQLTTLSHVLIAVFKEAFPRARDIIITQAGGRFQPQLLDASHIQLDNASLAEADLSSAWMLQVFLRKADLSHANLEKSNLSRGNLMWTDFSHANLSYAHLRDTRLYLANLHKADLSHANLRKANLNAADLSEAILTEADLTEASLYNTNFCDAQLCNTKLYNIRMGGGYFSDANLSNADLHNAHFAGVGFSGANLSNADLSNIETTGLYPSHSRSTGKTYFNEANLSGANLSGAILRQTDFTQANLTDANLSGATFTHTNLEDAQSLERANLRGAKGLTKEQLTLCKAKGAIVDEDLTSDTPQLIEASNTPSQDNTPQDSSTLPDIE